MIPYCSCRYLICVPEQHAVSADFFRTITSNSLAFRDPSDLPTHSISTALKSTSRASGHQLRRTAQLWRFPLSPRRVIQLDFTVTLLRIPRLCSPSGFCLAHGEAVELEIRIVSVVLLFQLHQFEVSLERNAFGSHPRNDAPNSKLVTRHEPTLPL